MYTTIAVTPITTDCREAYDSLTRLESSYSLPLLFFLIAYKLCSLRREPVSGQSIWACDWLNSRRCFLVGRISTSFPHSLWLLQDGGFQKWMNSSEKCFKRYCACGGHRTKQQGVHNIIKGTSENQTKKTQPVYVCKCVGVYRNYSIFRVYVEFLGVFTISRLTS